MYVLGDRVSIGGQRATVRYVGPIDAWKDTLAYGVEWDEPERGKNSGNVGTTFYFRTTVPGAGSFVKANSRKIEDSILFENAVVEAYGKDDNMIKDEIRFGSKVVQNLGFDKLNEMNSAFDQLQSITVDKRRIFKCEKMLLLPNLVRLDLSFNLFKRTSDVWSIIDEIPQLQELSLNGNRFEAEKAAGLTTKQHGLKKLKLSSTKISMVEVKTVLKKFTLLREITLASNDYNDEDVIHDFDGFQFVDLSFNNLTVVPNLKTASLDVSDNRIQHLWGHYELKSVDLRNNSIDTWGFLDQVYDQMQLQEIRIVGNPLFVNLEEDEVTLNLMARTDCYKINGTLVTPDERRNAELYVIGKILKEQAVMTSSKWQRLVQKYNIDPTQHKEEDKNGLRDMKIQVNVFTEDQLVLSKTILKDFSVLRLKGLIGKELKKSILDFEVFHYLNDTPETLDNDITRIQELGLDNHENLYIRLINQR